MARFVIASAEGLQVQAGHGVAAPYAMTLVTGAGALDLTYEECKRITIDCIVLVLEEPDILLCVGEIQAALERKEQKKEEERVKKQAKSRAVRNVRDRGRVRKGRADTL